MAIHQFHPIVQDWFARQFNTPTKVQELAWSAIAGGDNTLIAAPTGSGKTLAAFLASIDSLLREGLNKGLAQETRVLYISPLKALSNDIQQNLQQPLNGVRDGLLEHGLGDINIEAAVRTGDTPQTERSRMRRHPPHILVTTPESVFILLSSDSGREILKTIDTVIVDEIHALAGNKRGAHLMLSLERLAVLCAEHGGTSPKRIGLSATQSPIEEIARYIVGGEGSPCTIIDTGHERQRDLKLEIPRSPLEAIMANETWAEIYDRLAELISEHRTTLIFVNTRRLAERAAHNLAERIGEDVVTAHHGSLAREHRLHAEKRLKGGHLRALVATASLELGIDIGDVDLVCQLGSPHSIATFLQRVGRSGHAVAAMPKGRLFPLSRDDLVECTALIRAIEASQLDNIRFLDKPLDVLAQQIVAEVASREWSEPALFQCLRRAWPYRDLSEEEYTEVVCMLADGFSTRRGRRGAYLHRDAVNQRLRARRGARLTALTNAGTIPDLFDYDVVLQPQGQFIGNLNEDFAFESMPGDIFQLGNTAYRMLKIEQGKVYVEDANGLPPSIPFWTGEAPGRTDELSKAVSTLHEEFCHAFDKGIQATDHWFKKLSFLPDGASQQLREYLTVGKAALGTLPTHQTIIFERFFDDVGDMHFVIHSPFGSRINRAWGLALRKRFCRKFNFELQAAATENNIVLSLGPTHSFPMDEVRDYLHPNSVRQILIQAMLDAPVFATRWRWNANVALAVQRNRNGKRIPAQFQRSDAEDLVSVIFPDQLACFENIAGEREIPDHPLVNQTIKDCLYDNMDIVGLERLLTKISNGQVSVICCELTAPSPLSQEIITAKAYAFLDDAAAEERRTLNIQQRRDTNPRSAADLGRLDADAIERVRQEAWPEACTADELHDGLVLIGFMTDAEIHASESNDKYSGFAFGWQHLLTELIKDRRVTQFSIGNIKLWVSVERLGEMLAIHAGADLQPVLAPLLNRRQPPLDEAGALREITRSRLEGLGPVNVQALADAVLVNPEKVQSALLSLEQEGFAIQGHFTLAANDTEWCDRRLLARIHRYTMQRLRNEIDPVSPAVFMRLLFHWQHLDEQCEGKESVMQVLTQLEGCAIPAAAWEGSVIPSRIKYYIPEWLDGLCTSGRIQWQRLAKSDSSGSTVKRSARPLRNTSIALMPRQHIPQWINPDCNNDIIGLSIHATQLYRLLQQSGALFFMDLVQASGLLRTQVEDALAQLAAQGFITSDSFAGLRALITPSGKRRGFGRLRRHYRSEVSAVEDAGRWTLVNLIKQKSDANSEFPQARIEHITRVLLQRYGILFRKILDREQGIPPWRDILYVLRRLEARGEIRGGRFVNGFAGEQFALPEALSQLRRIRKEPACNKLICINAADPLNLTGIVTGGQRIPALNANRIAYRDGVLVAFSQAGRIQYLIECDASEQWVIQVALIGKQKIPAREAALAIQI